MERARTFWNHGLLVYKQIFLQSEAEVVFGAELYISYTIHIYIYIYISTVGYSIISGVGFVG